MKPVRTGREWTRFRGWLWRRLPLRVRSAWSPYDNWLRGYTDGFAAATRHEARASQPSEAKAAELVEALHSFQSRWSANEARPSLNGWQNLAWDAIEAIRALAATDATAPDAERGE